MAIVIAGDKGRNAFVGNRGIHYLCETVIRQTFRCEDALKVSGSYGQFSRDAEKVNKLDLEKMIICTNTVSKTVFKYSLPSCFYIYWPAMQAEINVVGVVALLKLVGLEVVGRTIREQMILILLCLNCALILKLLKMNQNSNYVIQSERFWEAFQRYADARNSVSL